MLQQRNRQTFSLQLWHTYKHLSKGLEVCWKTSVYLIRERPLQISGAEFCFFLIVSIKSPATAKLAVIIMSFLHCQCSFNQAPMAGGGIKRLLYMETREFRTKGLMCRHKLTDDWLCKWVETFGTSFFDWSTEWSRGEPCRDYTAAPTVCCRYMCSDAAPSSDMITIHCIKKYTKDMKGHCLSRSELRTLIILVIPC